MSRTGQADPLVRDRSALVRDRSANWSQGGTGPVGTVPSRTGRISAHDPDGAPDQLREGTSDCAGHGQTGRARR